MLKFNTLKGPQPLEVLYEDPKEDVLSVLSEVRAFITFISIVKA